MQRLLIAVLIGMLCCLPVCAHEGIVSEKTEVVKCEKGEKQVAMVFVKLSAGQSKALVAQFAKIGKDKKFAKLILSKEQMKALGKHFNMKIEKNQVPVCPKSGFRKGGYWAFPKVAAAKIFAAKKCCGTCKDSKKCDKDSKKCDKDKSCCGTCKDSKNCDSDKSCSKTGCDS